MTSPLLKPKEWSRPWRIQHARASDEALERAGDLLRDLKTARDTLMKIKERVDVDAFRTLIAEAEAWTALGRVHHEASVDGVNVWEDAPMVGVDEPEGEHVRLPFRECHLPVGKYHLAHAWGPSSDPEDWAWCKGRSN